MYLFINLIIRDVQRNLKGGASIEKNILFLWNPLQNVRKGADQSSVAHPHPLYAPEYISKEIYILYIHHFSKYSHNMLNNVRTCFLTSLKMMIKKNTDCDLRVRAGKRTDSVRGSIDDFIWFKSIELRGWVIIGWKRDLLPSLENIISLLKIRLIMRGSPMNNFRRCLQGRAEEFRIAAVALTLFARAKFFWAPNLHFLALHT